MSADRRTFLKRAAATVALGAVAGRAGAQPARPSPAQTPSRALDPALLAALGDTVLPESLGAVARSQAVRAFSAWIAGYRPVVEEMHGYGDAEITYTPPDPAPGWSAQLAGLDLLARRRHARAFAALDVALRRTLLRTPLSRAAARLPSNPLTASHVAIALLAHWAASSDATDLAYGVRIGKGECRPLADSSRRPLPLAPTKKG